VSFGGGIQNNFNSTIALHNSIVANNTASSMPDCSTTGAPTVTAQNSLVETGTIGDACLQNGANNRTGDPNLGPLQNNGGPTETHALLSGSIAINAGANALAVDPDSSPLTTDQRGAGFPRIIAGTVDMGAYEAESMTYNFTGFFGAVDNPPVVNQMTAGKTVAFKFKLGGYQGMDVVTGIVSRRVACDSGAVLDPVEDTEKGFGGLTYKETTGMYSFPWKTSAAWAGTCRVVVLELADGTKHEAYFKF
jgi:hypothetical protein